LCASRGLGLVEVIVVLVIACLVGLVIIAALPRQREKSRLAQCQANLMQIGMALAQYEQPAGLLPTVPTLGSDGKAVRPSPLGALLDELGVDTVWEVRDPKKPPPKKASRGDFERPVAGFTCPSDPEAKSPPWPAPVNYRATTGDQPDGSNGPFAPGRVVRVADIEAADGLAYTAAFSERLVGSGRKEPGLRNYALVGGPVRPSACLPPSLADWRGDAGSSWLGAGWPSTLYNHSLIPNATPSCIAADGLSAFMGASSGHGDRVYVLLLDGHVRAFTSRIDPKIWRGLANINDQSQEEIFKQKIAR
jgi:prepilin-type processing-associated H-X9-DG protein